MPQYAEVIVSVSAARVDRPFHYSVDEQLRSLVRIGSRVLVPFGSREVEGYVVGLVDETDVEDVKPIVDVVDASPVLTDDQLQLAEWLSDRYLCLRVEALQCVLPAGTRHRTELRLTPAVDPTAGLGEHRLTGAERRLLSALPPEGALVSGLSSLGSREWILRHAASLEAKGLLKRSSERLNPTVSTVTKQVVELAEEISPDTSVLTEKQQAVLAVLSQNVQGDLSTKELADRAGVTSSVVDALVKKGVLQKKRVEVRRDPLESVRHLQTATSAEPFELTAEQAEAVAAITREFEREGPKRTILLHGVTGSGKTEVYMRAVAAALSRGKQAIVLVPEIALTSQIVERFNARFGCDIAVLHSGLSLGERYDEWNRIREGRASIVIGARSAVFAPLPRLGVIIVDEEHETAYKQEESPRYHAREVAEKRAELSDAVLVLGSATPSIETYYRAKQGLIDRYGLPTRVCGFQMPAVRIVDMRQEEHQDGDQPIFSEALREAIALHIGRGGQVILFLNRRGHSTVILCKDCGHVMRCRHCDVALTYHSARQALRCHYCDFSVRPPDVCPKCKGRVIRFLGAGTEKVERQLALDFPGIEIARLDVDTTRRKHSHMEILERFRSGAAKVLVGTQMVAKGLDYPNVSLVGVVSADTSLNLPDFRSAERTFQLILQVAGRAGRSMQGGEVIVQTYCPDHYSILAASQCDYEGFFERELQARKEACYPPFTRMTAILLHGKDERVVMRSADRVAALLRNRLTDVAPPIEVLGPSPAVLVRVKDQYRWYVLLKGSDLSVAIPLLRNVITHVVPRLKRVGVAMSITVDPMNMM